MNPHFIYQYWEKRKDFKYKVQSVSALTSGGLGPASSQSLVSALYLTLLSARFQAQHHHSLSPRPEGLSLLL